MDAITDAIRAFLSPTAWEMTVPKAYGPLHLSFMLFGFVLCFFLAWKLRDLGEKGNRRLLLSVGIFLAVSEVYKQLMYEVVLEPGNGYRWGNFSFQLCSIPMYFCLILPFLRQCRLRRAMYNFLMTYNLLGGFIAFFEPSGLLHGYWTLTLHALIWHLLLVFVGSYIGLSGRGGLQRRDYLSATVTFGVLCGMAYLINFSFWEISGGKIKMFFLGPANSPIIVFKDLCKQFGWVIGNAIYIPLVCVGALLVFLLFRQIARTLQVHQTDEAEKKAETIQTGMRA